MENYSFWLCICVNGWMWSLGYTSTPMVHLCCSWQNLFSSFPFSPCLVCHFLLSFYLLDVSCLSLLVSFSLVLAYFRLAYFFSISISICTCLSLSLCLDSLSSQSIIFCWLNSRLFWAANSALSPKLFGLFRATEFHVNSGKSVNCHVTATIIRTFCLFSESLIKIMFHCFIILAVLLHILLLIS